MSLVNRFICRYLQIACFAAVFAAAAAFALWLKRKAAEWV
jgi:hypothetical protein